MEGLINKDILRKLSRFFSKRIVYHTVFWLTVFTFLMIVEGVSQSFLFTFSNEIINIIFYGILVYFNLLYLIPNYLTKERFFTYLALLILSTLLITPLKVILFYFKFTSFPDAQADLILNKNWHFLTSFFITGTSTIIKIIMDWARQLQERQQLQTQTMQSELRFLKSQINPHFLFNTLNNLYALTLKKSDKAPEIVIKLSEMMRYMLYDCNEKRVPLSKEVQYIKNYLDLEALRQGKNVTINFETEGAITDQKVAPLLFIPFLENSFKHGLNHHLNRGFVDIKLRVEDQKVDFFIENSKASQQLPHQDHKRSGGIGLVNVSRRLNILYPDKYNLGINETPNTYVVNLELNLE